MDRTYCTFLISVCMFFLSNLTAFVIIHHFAMYSIFEVHVDIYMLCCFNQSFFHTGTMHREKYRERLG
jgi:hypothetical protein